MMAWINPDCDPNLNARRSVRWHSIAGLWSAGRFAGKTTAAADFGLTIS
jgi:hypothetical protein